MLDAARLREYANIEIRYQLALNQAKQTLKFTQQQIEVDFLSGKDDIKEKVYCDLRKKKKDSRDILEKQQMRGHHNV